MHVLLQVVSQYSSTLSPLCVDAVMKVIDPAVDNSVDLRDIRVIQKLGYGYTLNMKYSKDSLTLRESELEKFSFIFAIFLLLGNFLRFWIVSPFT